MVEISGGGDISKEHMERLFKEKEINGVSLDIRPNPDFSWGEPNGEGYYKIPNGSVKFGIVEASIRTKDWLDLQYTASAAESRIHFRQSSTKSTEEWVEECVEEDRLHEVPQPVLEIDYSEYQVKAQEGRSRAIGALNAGLERIPIWVATRDYR